MFSNLRFRQKIFALLAAVFLFISAGLFVVYRVSVNNLVTEHKERLNRTALITSDRVKRREAEMARLLRLFQANRPMIEYLYIATVLGGDLGPTRKMLAPMYISLNVDSIVLYDGEGRGVFALDTMPPEDVRKLKVPFVFGELPSSISTGFSSSGGTAKITGIGPLQYTGGTIGYISVGKYIDGEYLGELKELSGNEFLFVRDGRVTASTLEKEDFPYLPAGGKMKVDGIVYSVHGDEVLSMEGKPLGLMVTAVSDAPLKASLNELRMYIFGMLSMSALVALGLSVLFIKALVNPLDKIRVFIGEVARGHFDARLEVHGTDEMADLAAHIDDMRLQLKTHRETLEHYTDNLEKAVNERTKQLDRMQKQLLQSQKMESLGTLSSGIAHDFNNILSAILGYSSMVKGDLEKNDPHYRYWDIVESAAIRGTELTGNLLTFSGGKVELKEKKPVEINQLVREVVKLLGRIFPKSISFKTALAEKPLMVSGNASALYQTIMNVCINARDAMPTGGRLMIETGRMRRDPGRGAAGPFGEFVRITITDNGMGMEREVVDRIFEPFFTTKEPGRGTGLGLSIVYGIVNEHNGFIDVYSEPGKGTSFKIHLPLSEEAALLDAEETPANTAAKPGETVLVVDDEEPIRMLCKEILEGAGYRVALAADGSEGIELYRDGSRPATLVVLDMIMPGMSGYETFKILKAMDPDVNVLITSGFSYEISTELKGENGVKGFVQKPFRAKDFLLSVREAIGV